MGEITNNERRVRMQTEPSADGFGSEVTYKKMGWKGIDSEEETSFEKEVEFKTEPISPDELDMTPMVDVTFLLLIFFMVTASFTLQKSLEQPPAMTEAPSPIIDHHPKLENDYVQVTVDQTNTFYVTTRDSNEEECPSDTEMRIRVKDAKESVGANRLIILAHVDSKHSKVITAWDAGLENGMEKVEMQTTDEDF